MDRHFHTLMRLKIIGFLFSFFINPMFFYLLIHKLLIQAMFIIKYNQNDYLCKVWLCWSLVYLVLFGGIVFF